MISSIFLIFVLLKYWLVLNMYAKVPLVLAVFVSITVWTGVIVIGKYLSAKGNVLLHSWDGIIWYSKKETNIMKKFRRSCKPLTYCCGTQFVIGKGSLFVFYRGVVRGIVRALLTTQSTD